MILCCGCQDNNILNSRTNYKKRALRRAVRCAKHPSTIDGPQDVYFWRPLLSPTKCYNSVAIQTRLQRSRALRSLSLFFLDLKQPSANLDLSHIQLQSLLLGLSLPARPYSTILAASSIYPGLCGCDTHAFSAVIHRR